MRVFRSPGMIVSIGAALLLVALLIYGQAQTSPDRSIESAIAKGERKAAPAKELPKLSGSGTLSVNDFRGRVVVVNFWASWCQPCREEAPVLRRFDERHRRHGLVMLGINTLDVTSDARRFVKRYGLTHPMVRDPGGDQRKAWGLTGIPETFVVDRSGKIAAVRRGQVDEKSLNELALPVLKERK